MFKNPKPGVYSHKRTKTKHSQIAKEKQHIKAIKKAKIAQNMGESIIARTNNDVWKVINEAYQQYSLEISQDEVRKLFNYLMKHKKPQKLSTQKRAVIYDLVFDGSNPPSFTLLIKNRKTIPDNYIRFLENSLKDWFKLDFTSIKLKIVEVKKTSLI